MKKNYQSLLLIALLSLSMFACLFEVGASNTTSGNVDPQGMGYYLLTVYTVGEGSVPVANQSYDYNTVVNLDAITAEGWEFSGWSGDASGSVNTTITMDTAKTVTATFTCHYNLTMNTYVDNVLFNTGVVAYDDGYIFNGTIDLEELPPCWTFDRMTIDDVPIVGFEYSIVMNQNHVLSGYVNTTQLQLEVTTASHGETDLTYGLHTYAYGSEVNITATPATGYSFSHWTIGEDSNSSNPLTITLTENMTVTPVFTQDTANPTPTPTPAPTNSPTATNHPTTRPTSTPTTSPTTTPTPTSPAPTATTTPQPPQENGFYIIIVVAIVLVLLVVFGFVAQNRKKGNQQKGKW